MYAGSVPVRSELWPYHVRYVPVYRETPNAYCAMPGVVWPHSEGRCARYGLAWCSGWHAPVPALVERAPWVLVFARCRTWVGVGLPDG